MFEAIPPQIITGAGWGGLILLAVWFLLTDRLISRGSHLREIAAKNDHIAYLRQTIQTQSETVRVRDEQMGKLLTNSDLTVQLLHAMAREARRGDVAT